MTDKTGAPHAALRLTRLFHVPRERRFAAWTNPQAWMNWFAPVQRTRDAEDGCNSCATCRTEDRLGADGGLSRLCRVDWARTVESLDPHQTTSRST